MQTPEIIEASSYEYSFPWVDFFAQNILSCYGEITQKTDVQEMKILNIIKTKGEWDGNGCIKMSQRNLSNASHLRKKELVEILDTLQIKNLVREEKSGKYIYWKIAK